MKLRNKKTGEIVEATDFNIIADYNSLAGLNEDWEDYKEDKRYWYIDADGEIKSKELAWFNQEQDNIGNRFETEEDAKKVVEKFKAFKRLKDKGFKFEWWISKPEGNEIDFYLDGMEWSGQVSDDLDLLFGDKQ